MLVFGNIFNIGCALSKCKVVVRGEHKIHQSVITYSRPLDSDENGGALFRFLELLPADVVLLEYIIRPLCVKIMRLSLEKLDKS
jgi:hypothetical protein